MSTQCILQPHAAPSTAPLGVTVDTQSSSFSWSPPPLIDRNGIITKYTVTITEVESGKRVQQFDVNSTVTSVALRDLIQIPCYTYQVSVAAYTVEYGPTATFDITPTARNSESSINCVHDHISIGLMLHILQVPLCFASGWWMKWEQKIYLYEVYIICCG